MIIKTDFEELKVFCSTTEDGDISDLLCPDAKANRKHFIENTELPVKDLYYLFVSHKDKVTRFPLTEEYKSENDWSRCVVQSEDDGMRIDTDAIVTDVRGAYFYLGFADCNPVLLYDRKKHVLSFGHCSWRSTYLGLHVKMLEAMQKYYGCDPKDISVIFGPTIRAESYGFDDEPKQIGDPAWKGHITFEDGLYHIDLSGYIADCLKKKGVTAGSITMPFADTFKDPRFFSHYRSVKTGEAEGRFAFGAGMK